MATVFKVQPLLGDTPSNEVYLMFQQLNLLTAWVGLFTDALAAAADLAALKVAIAAVDITTFRVLRIMKAPPRPREFPTV